MFQSFFEKARRLAKKLFCYIFSVTNLDIESCKYCEYFEHQPTRYFWHDISNVDDFSTLK